MQNSKEKYKNYLLNLFKKARKANFLNFTYTLLRVEGLYSGRIDPLKELENLLAEFNRCISVSTMKYKSNFKKSIEIYNKITDNPEPYKIIINLLRCIQDMPYNYTPFRHLWSGSLPNFKLPNGLLMVKDLRTFSAEVNESNLNNILESFFNEEIRQLIIDKSMEITDMRILLKNKHKEISFLEFERIFSNCINFYRTFLNTYKKQRLLYKKYPYLIKLPNFEVFEILTNNNEGLYGFRVYFSNGSYASYERHADRSEPNNIIINDKGIGFFIGDRSSLRKEWMIGDKKLYEVGLPGKYNPLGVWKPLVFPSDTRDIEREIKQITGDKRIQGILFYMRCTGNRVVEFAMKAYLELPNNVLILPPDIHLYKCLNKKSKDIIGPTIWIYDGWLNLDNHSIEAIKRALIDINRAMNQLSIVYDSEIRWCLKYSWEFLGKGFAVPSRDDLNLLEKISQSSFSEEAMMFLDASIDWYKRGIVTENVFNKYLCYWISMEGLAIALFNGAFDNYIPLIFTNEERKIKAEKIINCIKIYFNQFYEKKPIEFVNKAYFECVKSLRFKTKTSLEKVFGSSHKYLENIYKKKNGYSLEDIRHKIAHGYISGWNFEDEDLVRTRIGLLQRISKDFLLRIYWKLTPDQKIPDWSNSFKLKIKTEDPRITMSVSRIDIFPKADWKIKSEWID